MICQTCGIEAKTRYVEFHQNIGALVMRFHKSMKANMCKNCVNSYFWRFTLTTLAVGWLGVISLVLAPIFVINNVVRYLSCLSLEPVAATATKPVMTEQVLTMLRPQTQSMVQRLKAGESIEKIATDVAYATGATPGQVMLYLRAMLTPPRR